MEDLKHALRKHGLSVTGKKAELVVRLQENGVGEHDDGGGGEANADAALESAEELVEAAGVESDGLPPVLPAAEEVMLPSTSEYVDFGKYRGRAFQEVFEEDPDYCRWVVTTAEAEEGSGTTRLKPFAYWLSRKAPELKEAFRGLVSFGKYKGQRFADVLNDDPQYCAWVKAESKKPDSSHSFRAFANFLSAEEVPELDVMEPDVVSFGKHRGQRYEAVLEQDPDYCWWVLHQAGQADAGFGLKGFAKFIKEKQPFQEPPF